MSCSRFLVCKFMMPLINYNSHTPSALMHLHLRTPPLYDCGDHAILTVLLPFLIPHILDAIRSKKTDFVLNRPEYGFPKVFTFVRVVLGKGTKQNRLVLWIQQNHAWHFYAGCVSLCEMKQSLHFGFPHLLPALRHLLADSPAQTPLSQGDRLRQRPGCFHPF